jgi:hypothetical protein
VLHPSKTKIFEDPVIYPHNNFSFQLGISRQVSSTADMTTNNQAPIVASPVATPVLLALLREKEKRIETVEEVTRLNFSFNGRG